MFEALNAIDRRYESYLSFPQSDSAASQDAAAATAAYKVLRVMLPWCLIAAVALEHGALLVHNDRDFNVLAQVEPALLVYPGRPH